jgi:hypothetical protein
MPTGYTSELYAGKDVTFEHFALRCARGMGVAIELRDEPLEVPLPDEFVIGTYETERALEAQLKLAEAYARTPDDWAALELKSRTEANEAYEKSLAESDALRDRYEAMLAEVNDWEPPTEEHEGLKAFMVEQLTSSIKLDTDYSYSWFQKDAEPRTWEQYRRDQLVKLHAEKKWAEQALREEEARVAGRNAWVRALRESLAAKAGA